MSTMAMIIDYNGCDVSKFPIGVSIVIGFEKISHFDISFGMVIWMLF
jgi:hypothetical protein